MDATEVDEVAPSDVSSAPPSWPSDDAVASFVTRIRRVASQANGDDVVAFRCDGPEDERLAAQFLAARNGDEDSACARYGRFKRLVAEFGLTTRLEDDLKRSIARGTIFVVGDRDRIDRPIICVDPGALDWSTTTVDEMRRLWFFQIMRAVEPQSAQLRGVVLIIVADHMGPSKIKMAFQKFVARAVQECMPFKVGQLFVVNQPWLFGSLIWPIIKVLLKEKIRRRISVIGRDYAALHHVVALEAVPVGAGGTLVLDPVAELHRAEAWAVVAKD